MYSPYSVPRAHHQSTPRLLLCRLRMKKNRTNTAASIPVQEHLSGWRSEAGPHEAEQPGAKWSRVADHFSLFEEPSTLIFGNHHFSTPCYNTIDAVRVFMKDRSKPDWLVQHSHG